MTDICIVTRLEKGCFLKLIKSIAENTSESTLEQIKIYVCYTGDEKDKIEEVKRNSPIDLEVIYDEYNFAKNSNRLAMLGSSDKILFLNDDIEIITDSISYCSSMLDKYKYIGTCGIKLLYPDLTIQHAGIVVFHKDLSFFGVTHLLHKQLDSDLPDMLVFGNTGAFLMVRREDFLKAGMFNEEFKMCFEDVVLNMKMIEIGKINMTALTLTAIHHESVTRKQSFCREDAVLLALHFNNNVKKILDKKNILKNTIKEVKA